MNPLIEAIGRRLAPAHHCLIITHVMPDGDAVGSLLGLGWLLREQGIDVTLACDDPVPLVYRWLPGSDDLVQRVPSSAALYDLAIGVDCSDRGRLGRLYRDELARLPLVNIDHHVTNTEFGTLNWVDPRSVATAQMILTLADTLGWPVSPSAATCLLTGLVTDTRSFRTANVDSAALDAALRLMAAGASLSDVARRSLDQQPLSWVRVLGEAIAGLHLDDGILWTDVTRAMRLRWALSEEDTSGITNFLAGVREADIVAVFAERDDGTVDVGMRAVPGLDVARIALKLGGGGHPQAAGFKLVGSLAGVRERALAEIRRDVDEQRRARAGVGLDRPQVSVNA